MMNPARQCMNQRTPKQPKAWNTQKQAAPKHSQAFLLTVTHIILVSSMLTKRVVLSPVDRADLATCRNAAAAQPAQSIGQKTHRNPKHVQILVLILGSIFGPQNGPRVGRLIKNPIKARIRGPFLGPFLGPKIGTKTRLKNAKKSAENSEKSDQGGSRDSEKVMQKPAKTLGTHCKSNRMLPPSADHLQRALATSTGCVYVMRHALHMI